MLQISQKSFLIVGLVSLFIVSSWLFMYHNRVLDPTITGDWWAVRFVEPNDPKSLVFEVESYSGLPRGSYEVFINGTSHESQYFTVHETVTRFTPNTVVPPGAQVNIVITLGDQKKSLIR